MASLKWSAIFLLAAFIASDASVPPDFKCPEMKVMENFEPEKYMGVWYEHSKYPFAFEVISRCISAKYSINSDGTITMSNKAFNIITNQWDEVFASAKVVAPGKLSMTMKTGIIKKPADYWILDTDYTSFAVVYHCNNEFKFIKGQTVWILTREMNPTNDVLEKAYKVLDSRNLTRDLLQKSYQTKCPKRTLF